MTPADILSILFHGNQLKRTMRTGWVMRGIPNAENVAAHSYGVSYIVLILAHYLDEKIDIGKALSMAVLHDLPEGQTTDIPRPAWAFLPSGSKAIGEQIVLEKILEPDQSGKLSAPLLPLWQELSEKSSPEARLVKDADNLDMYLQAVQYEKNFSNQELGEFWKREPTFFFPISLSIYQELFQMHQHMNS